ncbi:hypothetical protein IEN85_04655 [Pelagicoccus sp. NFK12]|uniref:DUF2541 family protein n=1 Tax=Pelagicoccus enzymogenes TaxID=2773457 RepID=A0A927IGV4_9BACT|nr:hypothetical protein [Pelagicoccus enzymogenes]MBD5778770.1 hypothetical protein [Pelagicoccus enzymogenes]
MRNLGVWRTFRLLAGLLAIGGAALLTAEEQPDWELNVMESKLAMFEAPQLHPKEDAWLFTCRMRVKSLNLIPHISKIEFKGVDAEEEVVWEKSHTIRRKDFEAAYGGGRSQFVRVFIRDVPANVKEVQLHYGSEEEASE